MGAFGSSAQQSAIQGRVQQRRRSPLLGSGPMPNQPAMARPGMATPPPMAEGEHQAPLQTTLFEMLRSGKGKSGDITGPAPEGGVSRRSLPEYDPYPTQLRSGRPIQT